MNNQMLLLFTDPNWRNHFYGKRILKSPTDEYDCMVECLFIESEFCQFYINKNQTCYLGNLTSRSGTVLANVTVNTELIVFNKCKEKQIHSIKFFKEYLDSSRRNGIPFKYGS